MAMVFRKAECQPENVEFSTPDGIFVKQYLFRDSGSYAPQHSHKYDHVSMLAVGAVRVWCDDTHMGDFEAPMPIEIRAGVKHLFMTLEPNTLIYCIHNISRSGEVEIIDEHQIV